MTGTYAGQFVMEGFLDFTLPIWQRVLITRTIAIVPAFCLTFLQTATIKNMDNALNILQSIQLPFALVPLIKFCCNEKIMGRWTLPKWQFWVATVFATALFFSNFVILFNNSMPTGEIVAIIIVAIIYFGMIFLAIYENVLPLKVMTKEELDDHEYD